MFSKINIWNIIHDHWLTIKPEQDKSTPWPELLLFVACPTFVSSILVWKKVHLTESSIGILLASFSILTGLLFNLLVLLFDLIQKEEICKDDTPAKKASKRLKAKLLKETFANISFCVLLGLVVSVVALVALNRDLVLLRVSSWIVYSGGVVFILTLLMVLKRVHTLFSEQIPEGESDATLPKVS